MGKVFIVLSVVTALLIGNGASSATVTENEDKKPVFASSPASSILPTVRLERAYDAVPTRKTGPAVAAHLRKLTREARTARAPKFEVVMSPTVNKALVRKSVAAYERAMKIWQPLGLAELDLTWAFMSEKDYNWWLHRVEKYETEKTAWDAKVWNPKTKEIGHCKMDPYSYCGYGNPKPSGKTFQYNVIGSKYTTAPNPNTVHHEAVHFYQDSIDTGLMGITPCWFVEGQANLIGNVLDEASRVSPNRAFQIARVKEHIPNAAKLRAKGWVEQLNSFDGQRRDFCIKTELSYSLGMFIFEHLYANYSFRQIHELVLNISESDSFSSAVEQTLGRTQKALYADIAKYLTRQFRG
jgi:hypothetical protein